MHHVATNLRIPHMVIFSSCSEVRMLPAALRHLPLVREAIDQRGIHSTIDRLLPFDSRMTVSDADCATLIIMNILHGRVALYKRVGNSNRSRPEELNDRHEVGHGLPTGRRYADQQGCFC